MLVTLYSIKDSLQVGRFDGATPTLVLQDSHLAASQQDISRLAIEAVPEKRTLDPFGVEQQALHLIGKGYRLNLE